MNDAKPIPCFLCGYDVRAQPTDGICPECEASVAESHRLAPVPRRPAWRDSDPRWRRRMLAGAWLLVLLPLKGLLETLGWANWSMPTIFDYRGSLPFRQTLLFWPMVLELPVFCMGVALLCSRERGRRAGRLDWTRRWGVIFSYVVFILGMAQLLFLFALVGIGICALFNSMPLKYSPAGTLFWVDVCAGYIRHVNPSDTCLFVQVGFASLAVLMACASLFDALRSSGSKWLGLLLLPLGCFATVYLLRLLPYFLDSTAAGTMYVDPYATFFWSEPLLTYAATRAGMSMFSRTTASNAQLAGEAIKWSSMMVIAVWLSLSQLRAWRSRSSRARI